MKINAIILLLGLAALQATLVSEPININYHEDVGIPAAKRIRKAEEAFKDKGYRIVGGMPAAPGEFPYQAGLVISLTSGLTSVCGASLLTNTRLITAAHCWRDSIHQASEFTVVLGSTYIFFGGTRIITTDVEVHSNYNPYTFNNDIAMIAIAWITYTNEIQPIALPSGFLTNNSFANSNVVASGYGITSDSDSISSYLSLHHVTLSVITNDECMAVYGASVVLPSTLCTSGANSLSTCNGDSGGPVAFFNTEGRYLVGVVSFLSLNGCQIGFPAGHARVTSFLPWIHARL